MAGGGAGGEMEGEEELRALVLGPVFRGWKMAKRERHSSRHELSTTRKF
jgi:hypothetical protein